MACMTLSNKPVDSSSDHMRELDSGNGSHLNDNDTATEVDDQIEDIKSLKDEPDGLIYGVGSSLAFFPSVGTIPEWFTRHRGLASGIAVCGVGIGGFVLSPVTEKLISCVGVNWTLRIMGIMSFVMLGTATLLIKSRVARDTPRPFSLNLSLFRQVS
ncbi:uncharacterized protein VTP21DRAFT_2277 [Calcarisporiella thermophila]|uniref:uncharacterized protein n=1 Tax=Calcarisporiella thermophila TaxID=911321 RepID=UPI0037437DC8